MKAWEKELEILRSGVPCYQENDNETIWEEEAAGPESDHTAAGGCVWRMRGFAGQF